MYSVVTWCRNESNRYATARCFECDKILLLGCIHHFNSDLIYNIDHMRISGNEPSSVILSQTKWFRTLNMIAKKCQIKVKPNGMV